MRVWNVETIESALKVAARAGESIVGCETHDHANRFRMAVYNYRRRRKITIPEIQITVSGTDVIIYSPTPATAELRETING